VPSVGGASIDHPQECNPVAMKWTFIIQGIALSHFTGDIIRKHRRIKSGSTNIHYLPSWMRPIMLTFVAICPFPTMVAAPQSFTIAGVMSMGIIPWHAQFRTPCPVVVLAALNPVAVAKLNAAVCGVHELTPGHSNFCWLLDGQSSNELSWASYNKNKKTNEYCNLYGCNHTTFSLIFRIWKWALLSEVYMMLNIKGSSDEPLPMFLYFFANFIYNFSFSFINLAPNVCIYVQWFGMVQKAIFNFCFSW
jgi:hypothetical protein